MDDIQEEGRMDEDRIPLYATRITWQHADSGAVAIGGCSLAANVGPVVGLNVDDLNSLFPDLTFRRETYDAELKTWS